MNEQLIEQLKRHEGFRPRAYRCTAGKQTIAYGYNLTANPLKLSSLEIYHALLKGIAEVEAERLLKLLIASIRSNLSNDLDFWPKLDAPRQDVLINMSYNMGIEGLFKFKQMLLALEKGDYHKTAMEMLDSKWAKLDVPKRAKELSRR